MSTEEEITEELEASKKKKEPSEVIEIRHTDDRGKPLTGNERQKMENLELIVEAEAMKQFETEKENLLKKIPEGRRDKISDFIGDDPTKIESVRANLILAGQDFDEDDDNKPQGETVAGRATIPDYMLPQNQEKQIRSTSYSNPTIQMFSDLYGILRSPTTSEAEKKEAESVLGDAFVEIGKGLRSRSRNNPYSLPSGCVSHCMKCGYVVEADLGRGMPCPSCGHRFGIDKMPRNPKFHPR